MPSADYSGGVKRSERKVPWEGRGLDQLYGRGRMATMDILPDDVLIEIFTLHLDQAPSLGSTYLTDGILSEDSWQILVHVCRRWRCLVFEFSAFFKLKLLCTPHRPARMMLDVWPPFPIVVRCREPSLYCHGERADNIIEAFKQHNRVCKIDVQRMSNMLLGAFSTIKDPFPNLTRLRLWSFDDTEAPVLPGSILGGSAPRLRSLFLYGIPIPAVWKFLSSTTGLVRLHLHDIPSSGYFSPKEMVAGLSSLAKLEVLRIVFEESQSFRHLVDFGLGLPNSATRTPLPRPRVVVPALSSFHYTGGSKYLEDVMDGIDTPALNCFTITFPSSSSNHAPLLRNFLSRWEAFQTFNQAEAIISQVIHGSVLYSRKDATNQNVPMLVIETPCIWSFKNVFRLTLPSLTGVEYLNIRQDLFYWDQDILEKFRWVEFLRLFTSLTNLVLYEELARHVLPDLQELAEDRGTKGLSSLQNISIAESQSSRLVQEAIGQFAATRELYGWPVTVDTWEIGQESPYESSRFRNFSLEWENDLAE